jgi:NAD(P)-dependent dehydrogenase (short-subunit alcohol dehydrogenase family)/SAM-dependent methyltransferase/aryl carrier-like protein
VGMEISADALRRDCGVLDRHARLVDRMLEILAEEGVLARSGAGWRVMRVPEPPALDAMSRTLSERVPEYADEIALAERCGRSLAEVLRGRRDPMDVLFPQGSQAQLERVYQDAPGARVFNGLVQATVDAALSSRAPRRRIRILEIGAGTGSTAAYLLPGLDPHRTSYTFTDVSNAFLIRAKEKFREHAFVDYRLLDIGSSPAEQGFEPHAFDVIVASHVLHATPDLRRTLSNVRTLLAPEGLLVLLESTRARRFLDITFGLTDGWWGFTDADVRPSCPLISADRWAELLRETGFVDAASIGERAQGHETGAAVIVARGPRVEPAARVAVPGWIVLADTSGSGERLARTIRARGEGCTLVVKGRRFENAADDRLQMNPLDADDYARLVEIARDPERPCRGIVHFWSLDERMSPADRLEDIDSSQQRACGSILSLAQALAASGLESPPRLIVVTRGAQAVVPELEPVEPAQATAWGLGRVVAREHPELHCTCVDLDPDGGPTDEMDALYDDVLGVPGEEQVALRHGERLLPQLVRAAASSAAPLVQPLARNGAYLVTGGLGGVGLLVAQRLAERGAGRLVLMGRTGPSETAERAIRAMTERGTDVLVVQADVADRGAIASVIDRLQSDGTPLRGIVHSAGTIDDGVLLHQNWDRFRTVMAAKVHGSWNLHVLTRALPLDFFVLFSSSASLFGPPGQGNHAAVNAFVDALAHHRRVHGLPGASINWGPWSQVGAAARGGVVDRSELHGLGAIDPDQGLLLLEHVMRAAPAQVGVLPIDWGRLSEAMSTGAVPARLRHLARLGGDRATSAVAQTAAPSPSILEQLEQTPPHRRAALVLAHVAGQASQVLGLDSAASLDPQEGLRHLGLDSLMALELRNRLQRSVGQPLRSTLAFDYPTIDAIARHLLNEVLAIDQGTDQPQVAPARASDDASDLLRDIEQLSDEQAERLFAERVVNQGA